MLFLLSFMSFCSMITHKHDRICFPFLQEREAIDGPYIGSNLLVERGRGFHPCVLFEMLAD